MTPEQLTTLEWQHIPPLVEAIIARSMVERRLVNSTVRRPMRFADFQRENNYAPARTVWGWIRAGVNPNARDANKIKAWCKKHLAVLN